MTTKSNREDAWRRHVLSYYDALQSFERSKKHFEETKREFYAECEKRYSANQLDSSTLYNRDSDHDVALTRIQKVSITFDVPALEQVLSKDQREAVIQKTYTVTDFNGFVRYLKSIGADPKVVRTFLTVSKAVDEKALDQLEAIGKIDVKTLENCYTVTKKDPYFKLRLKDRAEDGKKCDEE